MDGVMEDIRNLLAEGESSREIIERGFAPRTVYKVQRDFRRKDLAATEVSPSAETGLRQEVEDLTAQLQTLEAKDPCPMCGEDVGWSKLPARKSVFARFLEHGYYRRCPRCRRERQVAA